MNCYFFALFCLTVAVSHVHSLDCCDENFITKYKLDTRPILLERKKSLGKYKVDVVSVADASRFTSVAGFFFNNGVNVSVVRVDGSKESRSYSYGQGNGNTYHQIGENPKVDITLYNIKNSDGCLCEYGCIKKDEKNPTPNCFEGTPFYQCVVSSTNVVKESGTICKDFLENQYGIKLKTL